ncbi:MAG: amidase [Chloroflexi bacterium]|nr:amidase [Chloroflexota bacterium]
MNEEATGVIGQTLTGMSATDLAEAIRERRLSAREVVEAHVNRIEAVDVRLNAVVIPTFERALAEADLADAAIARGERVGPLHGVPITVKEQFEVSGTDATFGLRARIGDRAARDGPLVAKLRRAGAIIVGKTNLPQLMLAYETDNDVYGRTNNPWDLERTPGGSSGGEAAIIAAEGSPLGLAGDMGGSIRVPAHFCGIHGLKPTSGRLTNDDSPAQHAWTFAGQQAIVSQPGPLARSVADLSAAMRVLAEPEPNPVEPPVKMFAPESIDLRGLRFGMYTGNNLFPAAPALRRAVEEAADALRSLGTEVLELDPPDATEAMRIFVSIVTSGGPRSLNDALGGDRRHPILNELSLGLKIPNAVRPALAWAIQALGDRRRAFLMRSAGPRSAYDFWGLVRERDAFRRQFLASLDRDRLDGLICPPHSLPALTHGSGEQLFAAAGQAVTYNLLGVPAGVVAATRVRRGEESDRPPSRDGSDRAAIGVEQGSAGLPVGVQVVARYWREDVVLAVMSALEAHFRTTPDYPSSPPLS